MSVEKISVEDSIKQAITEVEEKENDQSTNNDKSDGDNASHDNHLVRDSGDNKGDQKTERTRDEGGKFAKKTENGDEKIAGKVEEKPEVQKTEPAKEIKTTLDAPQSLSGAIKAKWKDLPADVQQEWSKREEDIHKMFTRHDGELKLGRDLKEVITPYMPLIQARGSNPVTAIQSLLNASYILNTAPTEQKVALFRQLASEYSIPLDQVNQPVNTLPPEVQSIKLELDQVKNQLFQEKTLQQQNDNARIQTEIQAFAADPKHIYFEQVKAAMAPLLGSQQAKDLQEAYDMACWANPTIRTSLIAAQETEAAEKRKAEVAKKKQAAVSVTGSPGVKSPNSGTPQHKTAEESVREAMDEHLGSRF